MQYDYVIVGAGPAGLTLATQLAPLGFKIAVIEAAGSVGGCHRARRDAAGYFGEHGPRVYSGCYLAVKDVLRTLGTTWDRMFVPAPEFSPHVRDSASWAAWLSPREVLAIGCEYCAYAWLDSSRGRNESVASMCRRWNFSATSINYLDSVCRFSDGAGAERYTLFEFFNGFDQHTFSQFYEPRLPHDVALFPLWTAWLARRGVTILTNTPVHSVVCKAGSVVGVRFKDGTVARARRGVVLAVPPQPASGILKRSELQEPGFHEFAQRTAYTEYRSVCLHFKTSLVLPAEKGLRTTPWGLIYIEMSRYTRFEESPGVVSAAATLLDVPSPRTGKTARQCTPSELGIEVTAQLSEAFAMRLRPVHVVVPPDGGDEAFVASVGAGFWPSFAMTCARKLYTLGTHHGMSTYHFTSMESAVQNAMSLSRVLLTGEPARPPDICALTVSDALRMTTMLIVLIAFLR